MPPAARPGDNPENQGTGGQNRQLAARVSQKEQKPGVLVAQKAYWPPGDPLTNPLQFANTASSGWLRISTKSSGVTHPFFFPYRSIFFSLKDSGLRVTDITICPLYPRFCQAK